MVACTVVECLHLARLPNEVFGKTAEKMSLLVWGWSQLQFLAFSTFCDTSGVTNRINKCVIALKGNSSGFNRILIIAYRCLLVTLNYRAFPLFASFSSHFSRMSTDKWLVFCNTDSQPLFLICLIIFYIPLFFFFFYSIQTLFYSGLLRP